MLVVIKVYDFIVIVTIWPFGPREQRMLVEVRWFVVTQLMLMSLTALFLMLTMVCTWHGRIRRRKWSKIVDGMPSCGRNASLNLFEEWLSAGVRGIVRKMILFDGWLHELICGHGRHRQWAKDLCVKTTGLRAGLYLSTWRQNTAYLLIGEQNNETTCNRLTIKVKSNW